MIVLGIESSCDDTGIALYSPEQGLLISKLASQVETHARYQGVVPELASRDHFLKALPLLAATLEESQYDLKQISAIAYTNGPGLMPSLLVGTSIAKSLAYALEIPCIGVHHLEGHLLSPLLALHPPTFPHVALLVSGGHTQLIWVKAFGDYTLLGESIDDAVGEAFDKTAKLLGLGFSGGPALERLAATGDPTYFDFPRPLCQTQNFNFSFSGLKTSVRLAYEKHQDARNISPDIAASFTAAVCEVLGRKALLALQHTGCTQLVISGGVSANKMLRQHLQTLASHEGFELFYPPMAYCTDNGAMIALAGALHLQRNDHDANWEISPQPRWDLRTLRT